MAIELFLPPFCSPYQRDTHQRMKLDMTSNLLPRIVAPKVADDN